MPLPAENRFGGRRLPLSIPVPLEDERGNALGEVLDLSLSGLRLATPRLLPLNRPTSIVLQGPRGPIALRGTLLWARKGEAPRTFQMGMRFDGISSEAREGLQALLNEGAA